MRHQHVRRDERPGIVFQGLRVIYHHEELIPPALGISPHPFAWNTEPHAISVYSQLDALAHFVRHTAGTVYLHLGTPQTERILPGIHGPRRRSPTGEQR